MLSGIPGAFRAGDFLTRVAGNIGLQLVNRGGLDGNNPVDEVANRDDA